MMISRLRCVVVLFLIQLLLLDVIHTQNPSKTIHRLSKRDANSTRPGVWLRLTPAGTSYIATMITRLLAPEIVSVQMPSDISPTTLTTLPTMSLSSFKLRALSISDVSSFITSSNLIGIRIRNSIISVEAIVNGQIDRAPFNGPLEIRSRDFKLDVHVNVERNDVGNAGFKIEMCRVPANVPVTVLVKSMSTPQSITKITEAVTRDASKFLQELICPRIRFLIENRVNQRLSLLTTRIALNELDKFDLVKRRNFQHDSSSEQVLSSISQVRRQQHFHKLKSGINVFYRESLTLDYTIMNTPEISERGVEMVTTGEISSPGSRTPFGPPTYIQHPDVSRRSLQLVVSEYVPNTLMYHGHKIGIFNTRIDPTTPQFGQIMHTTCGLNTESLFCVGDLFPSFRERVPNRDVIFLFSTTKAPVVTIHSRERGGVHYQMFGLLEVFSIERDGETPRGAIDIYIEATMHMKLKSRSVRGKIALDSLKMTTRSPQYFVQEELDDASFLSYDILQRIVNGILKRGVPIPIHPLFKLLKPKLTFIERSFMLETDFELDPNLARQLISEKLT